MERRQSARSVKKEESQKHLVDADDVKKRKITYPPRQRVSRMNNADQEFVERRINELDRRRNDNLEYKLSVIEKLFTLSLSTRSEALSTALHRIQGDSKECNIKCSAQVKTFYSMIDEIKEKCLLRNQALQVLQNELDELKSSQEEMGKEFSKFKTLCSSKGDSVKNRLLKIENTIALNGSTKNEELAQTVQEIVEWKNSYLIKNFTVAVVTAVVTVEIAFRGFTWMIDYVSKITGFK